MNTSSSNNGALQEPLIKSTGQENLPSLLQTPYFMELKSAEWKENNFRTTNKENAKPRQEYIHADNIKNLVYLEEGKTLNNRQSPEDEKENLSQESKTEFQLDLQDVKSKIQQLKTLKINVSPLSGPLSAPRSFGLPQNQFLSSACENVKKNGQMPQEEEGPTCQHNNSQTKIIKFDISKEVDLSSSKQEEYNLMLRRKFNYMGDLIILERLGRGGFGKVYRVFDKTNRQFYALKKIKKKSGAFKDELAKQEYKALRHLSESDHPSLLRVLQIHYEEGESFFAVMEYGQGTLQDFLKFVKSQKPPISWRDKDILEVYFQIRFQITELKNIKLCHRDVKPQNIIISNDGFFLLADYGLSQILKEGGTQKMTVCGTPGYLAEAIQTAYSNDQHTCMVDPFEADLYSLEQTINHVMKSDGRSDGIKDLLRAHPTYKMKKRVDLYEDLKEKYKVDLFEKLYTNKSLKRKYEKLHVYIEYCDFDEITKWVEKKVEGLENDEAPQFYFLLGEIYDKCGKFSDALAYYEKSQSLTSNSNKEQLALLNRAMGIVAWRLSKYSLSKECLAKSLEIKKELKISDIAQEYRWLAKIDGIEGNTEKVLECYKKALEISNQEDQDKYNIDVIYLYTDVGEALTELARYKEAINYCEIAKDRLKQVLGEKHPEVGIALCKLGLIYALTDRTKEALNCLFEAMEIRGKAYSKDCPHVAYISANIAAIYNFLKQKGKALKYFERAIEILGNNKNNNPTIFPIMFNSAEICIDFMQYEKAETYLERCLKEYDQASLECRYSLGVTWIRIQDKIEKVRKETSPEPLNKRVERFKKSPNNHPGLLLLKLQLGLIKIIQRKHDDASFILLEAHNIMKETPLSTPSGVARWLYRIGQEYFEQNMSQKAHQYFSERLKIRKGKVP